MWLQSVYRDNFTTTLQELSKCNQQNFSEEKSYFTQSFLAFSFRQLFPNFEYNVSLNTKYLLLSYLLSEKKLYIKSSFRACFSVLIEAHRKLLSYLTLKFIHFSIFIGSYTPHKSAAWGASSAIKKSVLKYLKANYPIMYGGRVSEAPKIERWRSRAVWMLLTGHIDLPVKKYKRKGDR